MVLNPLLYHLLRHEGEDIPPIADVRQFSKAFTRESKKLWYLAGPAIFTSLSQYSLGAITQTFAGHVGTLELAAFSIENSVIAGLSFGVMFGKIMVMAWISCGQAYWCDLQGGGWAEVRLCGWGEWRWRKIGIPIKMKCIRLFC
ncbi:Protein DETOXIFICATION 29 [Castilleja foliolosa]|uniref:Protein DETOXIFICATION 29 n=1 Tax=Castilleja foliolosa TaxID=1961234 RepID=A0ABD3C3Z7_9LAMI